MESRLKLEISRTINMLSVHPENENNSEFRDRIDSLTQLLSSLEDLTIVNTNSLKGFKRDASHYNGLYTKVVAETDRQEAEGDDDTHEIGLIVCSHFGLV